MTLKLPKVIGHRGAAAHAPENTIEGIHTAADVGVEWVEIDVKLTKDDVPILMHDDTLDRTTNGSGLVAEKTYEEILQLEAGSWFADGFSGIKIPTFEEALEAIIDRGLGLSLEIKPCPRREKDTTEAVLDILSQYWDDHTKLLISSFSPVCLEIAQDMAPDWPRALLIAPEVMEEGEAPTLNPNWIDLAEHLDVKAIGLDQAIVTRRLIDDIHDLSLNTLIFTVNDPLEAREYQIWGVDSVFSDEPDLIAENLLTVH